MKDWDRIILNTYQVIYRMSTPSANFKKLLENAKINDLGYREIPYMDYEISETVFNGILKIIAFWYGIKGYWFKQYRNSILLGCSPKFKK